MSVGASAELDDARPDVAVNALAVHPGSQEAAVDELVGHLGPAAVEGAPDRDALGRSAAAGGLLRRRARG